MPNNYYTFVLKVSVTKSVPFLNKNPVKSVKKSVENGWVGEGKIHLQVGVQIPIPRGGGDLGCVLSVQVPFWRTEQVSELKAIVEKLK